MLNQTENGYTIPAAVPLLLCALACAPGIARAQAAPVAVGPSEAVFNIDGKRYEIFNGGMYEMPAGSSAKVFVQQIYDPDYYAKNYTTENGKTYRQGADGEKYPVVDKVDEGFEGTKVIRDLVNLQHGWNEFTLLSPGAPTVDAYARLRQRILRGEADFIDNRVEPSTKRAHSGTTSLATYAVTASGSTPVTKASLTNQLVMFKKGDDFWYSAWYYLEQGRPWSIVDLKSSYLDQRGGMRLMFTDDLRPYFQLKWPNRIEYKPSPKSTATLRRGQWTQVKVHFFLSEGADGRAELWLDGVKVIDGRGQTLPVAKVLLDSLEIGITSNPPAVSTLMYVDDIVMSHQPIN